MVKPCACPSCCFTANFRASGFPVLELATYNCPWLNTGDLSHTPTRLRVCPCALFIVVAKAIQTGN